MLSTLSYKSADAFEAVIESKVWGKAEEALVESADVLVNSLKITNAVLIDVLTDIEEKDPELKRIEKAVKHARAKERLSKSAAKLGTTVEELLDGKK